MEEEQKDHLTGLYSRVFLFSELEKLIEKSNKNNETFGIILSDLDDLKKFNDTYSHSQGDILLCKIAVLLQEIVENKGIIARLGGDEFVIFLPNYDKQSTLKIAEQLRYKVENFKPNMDGKELKPITVTLGLAVYPFHGKDIYSLLRNADEALIQGKNEDKNKVVILEKRFELP